MKSFAANLFLQFTLLLGLSSSAIAQSSSLLGKWQGDLARYNENGGGGFTLNCSASWTGNEGGARPDWISSEPATLTLEIVTQHGQKKLRLLIENGCAKQGKVELSWPIQDDGTILDSKGRTIGDLESNYMWVQDVTADPVWSYRLMMTPLEGKISINLEARDDGKPTTNHAGFEFLGPVGSRR